MHKEIVPCKRFVEILLLAGVPVEGIETNVFVETDNYSFNPPSYKAVKKIEKALDSKTVMHIRNREVYQANIQGGEEEPYIDEDYLVQNPYFKMAVYLVYTFNMRGDILDYREYRRESKVVNNILLNPKVRESVEIGLMLKMPIIDVMSVSNKVDPSIQLNSHDILLYSRIFWSVSEKEMNMDGNTFYDLMHYLSINRKRYRNHRGCCHSGTQGYYMATGYIDNETRLQNTRTIYGLVTKGIISRLEEGLPVGLDMIQLFSKTDESIEESAAKGGVDRLQNEIKRILGQIDSVKSKRYSLGDLGSIEVSGKLADVEDDVDEPFFKEE